MIIQRSLPIPVPSNAANAKMAPKRSASGTSSLSDFESLCRRRKKRSISMISINTNNTTAYTTNNSGSTLDIDYCPTPDLSQNETILFDADVDVGSSLDNTFLPRMHKCK